MVEYGKIWENKQTNQPTLSKKLRATGNWPLERVLH